MGDTHATASRVKARIELEVEFVFDLPITAEYKPYDTTIAANYGIDPTEVDVDAAEDEAYEKAVDRVEKLVDIVWPSLITLPGDGFCVNVDAVELIDIEAVLP